MRPFEEKIYNIGLHNKPRIGYRKDNYKWKEKSTNWCLFNILLLNLFHRRVETIFCEEQDTKYPSLVEYV